MIPINAELAVSHFYIRPRLAAITKHPKVAVDDYERRLQTMQSAMPSIQQAHLGTRERGVVVLEGWTPRGREESCGDLAGRSIRVASRFIQLQHHRGTRSVNTTFSAFGRSFLSLDRSQSSTFVVWACVGGKGRAICKQARMAERLAVFARSRRWRNSCSIFPDKGD